MIQNFGFVFLFLVSTTMETNELIHQTLIFAQRFPKFVRFLQEFFNSLKRRSKQRLRFFRTSHFRVTLCLCFRTIPRAKPFYKNNFCIKTNSVVDSVRNSFSFEWFPRRTRFDLEATPIWSIRKDSSHSFDFSLTFVQGFSYSFIFS